MNQSDHISERGLPSAGKNGGKMRMGNSLFIFILLMIGLERKKRLPCGRYLSRHATLFLMEHKL